MAGGRQPLSAMLTLVEHGTLWIIRLHKAVFNCAVIVYLYSALYSSTLFLDGHISAERVSGSYMENPRQNSLRCH